MRPVSLVRLPIFAVGLLGFLALSCQRSAGPDGAHTSRPTGSMARQGEKPAPPLTLPEPSAPPAKLNGNDLPKLDSQVLLSQASKAAAKGNYQDAATYQYWATQKTHADRYNLACYCARTNEVDAAFYWLQVAALDEGLDADHATVDEDLESLRGDPRWGKVKPFLYECGNYWEQSGVTRTVLVRPRAYKEDLPITVVVWLHGLGSRPDDFVTDDLQRLADGLNVAFLGVSGTVPRGKRSFAWSEDPARDARRIQDALIEVADRIQPGMLIAMGFSQGAQVGLEVAVRDPERFAGAIVMSPGTRGPARLRDVKPSPLLAQRGFVVVCGAQEHPGNVRLAAEDAAWLQTAKAQVRHKPYPGMSAHKFPPDFGERFPEWVRFIEGMAKKAN
jgi:predicted esterase